MSIWTHADSGGIHLPEKCIPHGYMQTVLPCQFCGSVMEKMVTTDRWNYSIGDLDKIHKEINDRDEFIKFTSMPPDDFDFDTNEPSDIECWLHRCPVCGWWIVQKDLMTSAKNWQVWQMTLVASGVLRNMDVSKLSEPIDDVRQFLCAKYQARHSLNPRLFEETVASVFRSIGHTSRVTAYSNDGGIDIILTGNDLEVIGIQVKRYKNRISVESIRSFLGALTVGRFVKGIFVTSSKFQKGAETLSAKCKNEFIPIDLVDEKAFLELLRLAQIKTSSEWNLYPDFLSSSLKLQPLFSHPMNSLYKFVKANKVFCLIWVS